MTAEMISLKLDSSFLKEIDKTVKAENYESRTEFIRFALRDKLKELSKDELIAEFLKFRGKADKKTTYEENRKTREEVSRELMEELDKKFSR
jgi:Arc/MetJ-type ribon-helix-helix transcriptional regulator